jgi:hypothetical protein
MPDEEREVDHGALRLLNDQPLGEGTPIAADGLGFQAYAQVLGTIALRTPGPFTVGVFGERGTGKTSLLRLIEDFLSTRRNVITVWFDAWRFESEEQPIVPLVATIVRAIEQNDDFSASLGDQGADFLRALRAVAYGFGAESKARVTIPEGGEIEAPRAARDMINRFEKNTPEPPLDRSLFFEAFQQLSKVRIPEEKRVVIMIDGLDHCSPDKAIQLLTSIKSVLAQPDFIFFLGVVKGIIEGYLQRKYQEGDGVAGSQGSAYLDKIVQLPFYIPPHRNRMPSLWVSVIARLDESVQESFRSLIPVISLASGNNPRALVRTVNHLLVDRAIYRATAGKDTPRDMPIAFFAVSRSLHQRWPGIFHLLMRSDELCGQIASRLPDQLPGPDDSVPSELKEVADLLRLDHEFRALLATEAGRHWLTQHDQRNATIDFLQRERSEAHEALSSGRPQAAVFLAYVWSDRNAGSAIGAHIRGHGFRVFDLDEGARNQSVALFNQPNLTASRAMIVLIGGTTKDSADLVLLVRMALEQGKPVVPVLLPGRERKDLPSSLLPLECINLKDLMPESLAQLTSAVSNIADRAVEMETPRL